MYIQQLSHDQQESDTSFVHHHVEQKVECWVNELEKLSKITKI